MRNVIPFVVVALFVVLFVIGSATISGAGPTKSNLNSGSPVASPAAFATATLIPQVFFPTQTPFIDELPDTGTGPVG